MAVQSREIWARERCSIYSKRWDTRRGKFGMLARMQVTPTEVKVQFEQRAHLPIVLNWRIARGETGLRALMRKLGGGTR